MGNSWVVLPDGSTAPRNSRAARRSTKGPVVVNLFVNGGAEDYDQATIDRAEWEAMTPQQRQERLEALAVEHLTRVIPYGWAIQDEEDRAAAESRS